MIRKPELISPAGLKVFARIQAVAIERDMDIQTVAMRYALERFLARVFAAPGAGRVTLDGTSSYEVTPESLTLKGGLTMFLAEDVDPLDGRSTSDADFHLAPSPGGGHAEQFVDYLRDMLVRMPDGADDGLRFDMETLKVARVKDGTVPGGKITITCQIGKFALQIRTDLAFDARPVHELAVPVNFPSVLPDNGLAPFSIRRTPFAYSVADKVQAMVRHGSGNNRLRDYYDLYVILSRGKADMGQLPDALLQTFELYGSRLPASAGDIPALSDAFAAEKAVRWDQERTSKHYGSRVPELSVVCGFLREALDPVLRDLSAEPAPF